MYEDEEVYNQYYDTAGNYHWTGVYSGIHIEKTWLGYGQEFLIDYERTIPCVNTNRKNYKGEEK